MAFCELDRGSQAFLQPGRAQDLSNKSLAQGEVFIDLFTQLSACPSLLGPRLLRGPGKATFRGPAILRSTAGMIIG
jgi:hypothetical protein